MHPEQMRGWGLAPADAAAAAECGERDFFAPDVAALAAATGESLQPSVPSLQPIYPACNLFVPRWRLATRDGRQLCRGRLRPARQVSQRCAGSALALCTSSALALCTSFVPALGSSRVAPAPICGAPEHGPLAAPPTPCSCLDGRCVCSVVQGKEVAVGPRCSVSGPVPPAAPRRAAIVVSPSGVDADGCGSTRRPCASVRHALLVQFWEWAPQLAESALARQQPLCAPEARPLARGCPLAPGGGEPSPLGCRGEAAAARWCMAAVADSTCCSHGHPGAARRGRGGRRSRAAAGPVRGRRQHGARAAWRALGPTRPRRRLRYTNTRT